MYLRLREMIVTLEASSHRLNHSSAGATRPIQPAHPTPPPMWTRLE